MNSNLDNIILVLEGEAIQVQSLKLRDDLNTKIFNKDSGYKMFEHIRNTLLSTAQYFIDFCSLEDFNLPKLPVVDLIVTGSLANYNWSRYSDIDLHIVMDMSAVEPSMKDLLQAYLKQKKTEFTEIHDITILNYEVELYMQDAAEPHVAAGIYSIYKDLWNKFPVKDETEVDWNLVKTKSQEYIDKIDSVEGSINFGSIKNHDSLIIKINAIWKKIKNNRKVGLSESGEFSVENLVFKVLRRNDYIGKILNLRSKVIDDKLSLEK